jgi:cystathionine beta-lyase/cystathionine gamma-synthase
LTRRLLPQGAGAMLAFAPRGGPPAADAVIRALRLIAYAPSLGGTETIASFPPQPEVSPDGGRPEPQTYRNAWIRLSIGLEAAEDVIADLDQALGAAGRDLLADEAPR